MFRPFKQIRLFSTLNSRFVVIGGGSGGLNVSAHLLKDLKQDGNVIMIEPSAVHHYQPGWLQLAAGIGKTDILERNNSDIVPKGVRWLQGAVSRILPEKNEVEVSDGQTVGYEHLIISSGVKNDWDEIAGAREALEDPAAPVCSIYSLGYAQKARRLVQQFKGGRAIFTEPRHPIKCSSAPQQFLYLTAEQWRDRQVELQYRTHNDNLSKVALYDRELVSIMQNFGAKLFYRNTLKEIKNKSIAVFQDENGNISQEKFDFLHLVPPSSAHKYIAESGLADQNGYCHVDDLTMQHKKFKNIWSIGDCSSLPCSKTSASLYTQTDVLMKNFSNVLKGQKMPMTYDGYSCCPIMVGGGKAILAEYKYGNVPDPSFFMRQQRPSRLVYALVKDFFPYAYWKFVPTGTWLGKDGMRTW